MATFDVVCSDPSHASRKNRPGFRDVLGTTSVAGSDGHLCEACAAARPKESKTAQEASDAEFKARVLAASAPVAK